MGTTQVSADIWAEREALSNIRSELSALEILVVSAQSKSNSDNRTTFDYQILLEDLQKIQSGISNHLASPMEPIVPSTINPLKANYTGHKN